MSIRRWIHDRRVFLWLCVLTAVMFGTLLRLALVIDDLKEEVDRSVIEDCRIQQVHNEQLVTFAGELVRILESAGPETEAGRRLVDELQERTARLFPTTTCP
jgi:hypothetical protein